MKRIKKLASIILAVVMALTMAIPTFAAGTTTKPTYDVSVKTERSGHTFKAYQIFKGDLAEKDGKEVLSNVEWGTAITDNVSALLNALNAKNEAGENLFNGAFEGKTTAREVSEVLNEKGDSDFLVDFAAVVRDVLGNSPVAIGQAVSGEEADENSKYTATFEDGLPAGYYLIEDVTDISADSTDAVTRFIVQVVGTTSVNEKVSRPGVTKDLYLATTEAVTGTGKYYTEADANSAGIGDHVSYVIGGKVPYTKNYKQYYYIISDTLSKGLTFDENITVSVGGTEIKQGKAAEDYSVYTTKNDDSMLIEIAFNDIRKYEEGKDILVTYSATVNDNAVVGNKGNDNKVHLEFTRDPNQDLGGDPAKPGLPSDRNSDVMGKTPDVYTLTFVTELDFTKYANDPTSGNELKGAEFELKGTSYQVTLKGTEYYVEDPKGEYYKLTDGSYTNLGPTGTSYEQIGVGNKDTKEGYIKQGEDYIIPEDADEYNGKEIYRLVKGTATNYADVNTKYKKETSTETDRVSSDVCIVMTSNDLGKFNFSELGEGTYTLTETITPDGFNTLDPITIEVKCNYPPEPVSSAADEATWTITCKDKDGNALDDFDVTNTGGLFSADIVNKSGSLLPETGGIGTTIFYVIGGILVIGAGVLLITRKRMSSEK